MLFDKNSNAVRWIAPPLRRYHLAWFLTLPAALVCPAHKRVKHADSSYVVLCVADRPLCSALLALLGPHCIAVCLKSLESHARSTAPALARLPWVSTSPLKIAVNIFININFQQYIVQWKNNDGLLKKTRVNQA